jgi:hypothetical protein
MGRIMTQSALAGSVEGFLNTRRGTQVLLTSTTRMLEVVPEIDPQNQWILEVQSWFELAFLRYRFMILGSVEDYGPHEIGGDPPGGPLFSHTWICNRALFLNGNFTNISFWGFLASTAALFLICVLSITDKLLEGFKKCRERLETFFSSTMLPYLRTQRTHFHDRLVQCHGAISNFNTELRTFFTGFRRSITSFWRSRGLPHTQRAYQAHVPGGLREYRTAPWPHEIADIELDEARESQRAP